MYDSLKQEPLQAQKTRDEVMKWKLLLVSGLGSAALGFSKSSATVHAELILCIIPFACLYADLLCRNLSIRTKLLSGFMAAEKSEAPDQPVIRFEEFYQEFDKTRRGALEGYALVRSTQLLSVMIIPAGIVMFSWANAILEDRIIAAILFTSADGLGLYLSGC